MVILILREHIWTLYGGTVNGYIPCQCCKQSLTYGQFQRGHVVAASLGGSGNLPNIRPVCEKCNNEMGISDMRSYMEIKGYGKLALPPGCIVDPGPMRALFNPENPIWKYVKQMIIDLFRNECKSSPLLAPIHGTKWINMSGVYIIRALGFLNLTRCDTLHDALTALASVHLYDYVERLMSAKSELTLISLAEKYRLRTRNVVAIISCLISRVRRGVVPYYCVS